MASPKMDKLLPQARALAADGAAQPTIAASLGISLRTVQRWAAADRAAGVPWPSDAGAARPSSGGGPLRADRLVHKLEGRLERLIDSDVNAAKIEDRALKICKLLDLLRAGDDPRWQLEAMRDFAAFCLRNLSEEEMRPVRRAIRLFIDDIRRAHS